MPRARKRYKPAVKAKFMEAAAAARAAGQQWKAAYVAAQQAGYRGSVDALAKMMATKKARRKPGRPAKATIAAPSPKEARPTAQGCRPGSSGARSGRRTVPGLGD
ncbi:MAG: hypothetical protein NTW87_14170 [Planctomycetota bacterium]|nr:hypothetical protein [Planctomycetota bacterium]